jgi:hypothetical protein
MSECLSATFKLSEGDALLHSGCEESCLTVSLLYPVCRGNPMYSERIMCIMLFSSSFTILLHFSDLILLYLTEFLNRTHARTNIFSEYLLRLSDSVYLCQEM